VKLGCQKVNGKYEERNINKKRFLLGKSLKRQLKNIDLVLIRYKMDLKQIHCSNVFHGTISGQHVLKIFPVYVIF
jgi:hypothetical protein